MKKTRLLMMFVAAAAMMFASCGKDDATEAADNTLILNGKTYKLQSTYSLAGDRSYAGATTEDLDGNGDPLYTIIADVEGNTLNKTYDLANPVEDEVIYWNIHDANWDFQLGPDIDGTATITRTNDVFVYKVNGTKGDITVSFNITVPSSQWE